VLKYIEHNSLKGQNLVFPEVTWTLSTGVLIVQF